MMIGAKVSEPEVRLPRLHVEAEAVATAGRKGRRLVQPRGRRQSAQGDPADGPKLVPSPTQRQDARRSGADVQCAHPRMDQRLRSVLPVGALPDLTAHRRLSGAMGRSEVQVLAQAQDAGHPLAATHRAPPDRPVRSLARALWTRPSNGSRMTRECHVRFCESAGVRPCHVSSPRLVERSMRISRTALSCLLRPKDYGTYPAGAAFGAGRTTRQPLNSFRVWYSHPLVHRAQPKPCRFRANPQNFQDVSAFALTYILRLRSCKSLDAFVISSLPSLWSETLQTAGPLRSAGVTPPQRYCEPIRHPLAFDRLPG